MLCRPGLRPEVVNITIERKPSLRALLVNSSTKVAFLMDNVISFPGVGTYAYNAERLHRYAGSLMKQERWTEFDIVMMMSSLYDDDLIDVDWCLDSGEPIAKANK